MKEEKIVKCLRKLFVCLSLLMFCGMSVSADDMSHFKLYFRFGESEIKPWFRENDAILSQIDSLCSLIDLKQKLYVKVVGAASPEGEVSFNKRLSRERANTLKNYITHKYSFPDSAFIIEVANVSEPIVVSFRDLRYALVNIEKDGQYAVCDTIQTSNMQKVVNPDIRNGDESASSDWLYVLLAGVCLLILCGLNRILQIIKRGKEIPFGNDGINQERRLLRSICRRPFLPYMYKAIDTLKISLESKIKIKESMRKTGTYKIPEWAKNGSVNLSSVAWNGIRIKLPNEKELIKLIQEKYSDINTNEITKKHIREITYGIGRQAVAERFNISVPDATFLIGLLDLAPHEAEDGYMEFVPNNIHRYKQRYAHKGYASAMLKHINGSESDDDED